MLLQPSFLPRGIRFVAITLFGMLAFGLGNAARSEQPGSEGNGNVVVGPTYKLDPDLTDRENPKGKSFEFSMKLADSKIFRGTDKTLSRDQ